MVGNPGPVTGSGLFVLFVPEISSPQAFKRKTTNNPMRDLTTINFIFTPCSLLQNSRLDKTLVLGFSSKLDRMIGLISDRNYNFYYPPEVESMD